MIAEAGTPVPWTKPEDLHYAPDEPLPELGGLFPLIINVALADGQAIALRKNVNSNALRGVITSSGGEAIDLDGMKAPTSLQAARLSEQNQNLRQELAKGQMQLDKLRSERRQLADQDAATDRLRKENEQLQTALRQMHDEAEQLRQEIERLKLAPLKRPEGGTQRQSNE